MHPWLVIKALLRHELRPGRVRGRIVRDHGVHSSYLIDRSSAAASIAKNSIQVEVWTSPAFVDT